jgi:hypothetical protein
MQFNTPVSQVPSEDLPMLFIVPHATKMLSINQQLLVTVVILILTAMFFLMEKWQRLLLKVKYFKKSIMKS